MYPHMMRIPRIADSQKCIKMKDASKNLVNSEELKKKGKIL